LHSAGCLATGAINIPNNWGSIGADAFRGCASVTEINLRDKGNAIGGYAFYGCINLARITNIVGSAAWTTIGEDAFYGCTNLSFIQFSAWTPGSLISDYAFEGCGKNGHISGGNATEFITAVQAKGQTQNQSWLVGWTPAA
jgi:hypothetical protein